MEVYKYILFKARPFDNDRSPPTRPPVSSRVADRFVVEIYFICYKPPGVSVQVNKEYDHHTMISQFKLGLALAYLAAAYFIRWSVRLIIQSPSPISMALDDF